MCPAEGANPMNAQVSVQIREIQSGERCACFARMTAAEGASNTVVL